MSNHNYPRRLLDDAIDRAVQELVHADPRPGFRRRVIAKIHAPARRSWGMRFLVPAGALAAAILLAIWLRPQDVPVPAGPAPAVAAERPVAAPTQATAPAVSEAVKPPVVAHRTPARRQAPVPFSFGARSDRVTATNVPGPAPRIGVEDTAASTELLEAAPALGPIHVAPLTLAPIVVKPIEVRPIGTGRGSR